MILGVALGTGNNNLKGGGRHLRLGGGGEVLYACVSTHMLGGSGGMLPQENFAN